VRYLVWCLEVLRSGVPLRDGPTRRLCLRDGLWDGGQSGHQLGDLHVLWEQEVGAGSGRRDNGLGGSGIRKQ
jgi:hypothetical protein